MSKISVYLNSGANIYSERRETGTHQEVLGISKQEWDSYTEEEKDSHVFELVMQWGEWGWQEK